MKIPTLRIMINDRDFELVKPALEFLAVGIANYQASGYTPRDQWKALFTPTAPLPYGKQRYNEQMAKAVMSARRKLNDRKISRKVRLDFIEISVVALALRLTKRIPTTKAALDKAAVAAFEWRLENLRRKAERASRKGNEGWEVDLAKAWWRRFCDWTRANLLFKSPDLSRFKARKFKADQRERLAALIRVTLEERHHLALSEEELTRVTRLLWEEFRRGRRRYRMREFLETDKAETKPYLFELVRKKLELTVADGAEKNWCVLAAERGDKFRNRPYQAIPMQEEDASAASAVRVPPASGSHGRRNTPVAVLPKSPQPAAPPRQIDLAVELVAAWLQREVPGRYWSNLKKLAPSLTGNRHAIHRPGTSLSEFIELTRQAPVQIIEGFMPPGHVEHLELTRFFLWAGAFLKSIFSDRPEKVVEVFQDAYHLAMKQAKTSTEAA